jgi:hypothetical protein
VLGVRARLDLPAGTRWTITALDSAGQRGKVLGKGSTRFEIDPAHATIWYLCEQE